jgi:ribulose-phosphate 3-epimerase
MILPSLICADLCNLEKSVLDLRSLGCEMLHIDIIDGYFSPAMPIGIETLRQLKQKTDLKFDSHIMARDSNFFVNEMISLGAERICFHWETEHNPMVFINRIRSAGIKAGIALNPATPVSFIRHALEYCDYVLIMCINPGYAYTNGEKTFGFIINKLRELRELIKNTNPQATITVDGRVGFDIIKVYREAGADDFVSGSSGVFYKGASLKDNWDKIVHILDSMEGGKCR